jgi:hypothetical protein
MVKGTKENIIKKYLPDIMIIIGVYIFSYSIFTETRSDPFSAFGTITTTDHGKLWGVVLVIIGINIAIRRYLSFKRTSK